MWTVCPFEKASSHWLVGWLVGGLWSRFASRYSILAITMCWLPTRHSDTRWHYSYIVTPWSINSLLIDTSFLTVPFFHRVFLTLSSTSRFRWGSWTASIHGWTQEYSRNMVVSVTESCWTCARCSLNEISLYLLSYLSLFYQIYSGYEHIWLINGIILIKWNCVFLCLCM